MNFRTTACGFLILLLSLFVVPIAFAHGDEPRLEISLERINPGGVIEVRGVDFELEELVTLELVGPDVVIPLGEIVANVEGVFVQIVTLPVDLMAGMYSFRALTDDHVIKSPTFEVWGMAILEGDDGQREDEDGLLVPMPTYAPGVSVTPMAQVETSETVTVASSSFPWKPMLIASSVLVVLLLVMLVGRRRAH